MTVYVDDMRARFGRMVMCHMMADTLDELHAMADRIGVARRWCQDHKTPADVHYDIALSKRALAVKAGAVEITLREMAAYAWHRRTVGFNTAPAIALDTMRAATRALAGTQRRSAGELVGKVFPPCVSTGTIERAARKYGVGREIDGQLTFSPEDVRALYEALPRAGERGAR